MTTENDKHNENERSGDGNQLASATDDAKRQSSLTEEEPSSIHSFPEPENNDSDGSTLIIKEGGQASLVDEAGASDLSQLDQATVLGLSTEAFALPPSEENLEDTIPDISPSITENLVPSESAQQPERAKSQSPNQSKTGPNWSFIALVSYASLVTLLALFLAFNRSQDHPLESLPDIAPESPEELSYVPPEKELAPGHQLKIGDKQRFGNIVVEVLDVVTEPIQFIHFTGNPATQRPPTQSVEKLLLKFTNVSKDQDFAPLDRRLTLRRVLKAEQQREYSNYYIVPANSEDNVEPTPMFHLTVTSDWDMKDQHLGQVLKPGESLTTYLAASDEASPSGQGPFLWRFQFRKGFSKSGHGVTTIAEVIFDRDDVTTRQTAAAKSNPSA